MSVFPRLRWRGNLIMVCVAFAYPMRNHLHSATATEGWASTRPKSPTSLVTSTWPISI